MEERIARIENNIEHIQANVSDLKVAVRRLDDKIDALDQKLTGKIDKLDEQTRASVKEIMAALSNVNVGRMSDRVWQLSTIGGVCVLIAKAFRWI